MLRELRTLVAVAQEGTFASAGARLGLTQAAVSAQMKRLEAELGYPLFDRSGRTARLTSLGQQTLERARELVTLSENLGSRRTGGRPAEILVTLGAIASVQRSVLPDVLARFHRSHAGCRTRVAPGLSMHLLDQVDGGELDMAVVIRPPFGLQRDLHWTPLTHEPFRLLVPKGRRGTDWAELLSTQPFIRYDRASFGGRLVDRFLRAAHISVHELCEVDELDAIMSLVAQGLGVALAPQTAGHRRWPAGIRAIDLGDHTFHRDIGLVHRAAVQMSEPARALLELVARAYRTEH